MKRVLRVGISGLKVAPLAAIVWTCTADSRGPTAPEMDAPGEPWSAAALSALTLDPLVLDAFDRTVAGGWGTADVGGAWRIDAHLLGDFSVDGSHGRVVKFDNGPRNAVATDGYGRDVAGLTSFSIDIVPDRPNRYFTVQVYARRDDRVTDGDNFYRYRVRAYGNGKMDVRVEKNVNGGETWLTDDQKLDFKFTAGQKYWIRWESMGASPSTTLRMRVWPDGTPEPTAWSLEAAVDEPALDVDGTSGIRVSGPNGSEQETFPATFSFDDFAYGTPSEVEPPPPNQPPTADAGGPYAGTVGSAVQFDGGASSDPDGDELTYAWDFGDGATAAGATPTHTYTTADTFTVTLTVTDPGGLTSAPATATAAIGDQPPPPNQTPTADAGGPYAGTAGVAIAFDGTASSDPDGDLPLAYAWDFGDGSTGTGATPTHTYATAGGYTVSLVVTDARGGASGPSTAAVTVEAPAGSDILVKDGFDRAVTSGWGSADVGGPWRIDSNYLADFRTSGSRGQIAKPNNLPRNAIATNGYGLNVSGRASFSVDTPIDYPSRYYTVQVYARRDDRVSDGDNYYRYRVRLHGDGEMDLRVEKNVNANATWLVDNTTIPTTFVPGQKYWIRWECIGTSPSTRVRMRVWRDGDPEPTAWAIDLTVNEPALDVIGTTGFRASGPNGDEQTTFPVNFNFDDLEYVEVR